MNAFSFLTHPDVSSGLWRQPSPKYRRHRGERTHSQPCKFPRTSRIKTFSVSQAWCVIECSILVVISREPLPLTGKVGVQPGPTVLTDLNQTAGVCAPLTWEASMSPERGARRATPATGACVGGRRGRGGGGGWGGWDIWSLISNTVAYSHTQLRLTLWQTWSYSVFNQSKWCRPTHGWEGSDAGWDERRLQPEKKMTIII